MIFSDLFINIWQVNSEKNQLHTEEEIDLLEILKKIWDAKINVLLVGLVFCLVFFSYSLTLENKYESQAILKIKQNDNNSTNQSSDIFNQIRSFSIGPTAQSSVPKVIEGIEIIKSRDFLTDFIQKYEYLPLLYAFETWDEAKKQPVLMRNRYDSEKKTFIGAWENKVSLQKAHQLILDKHLEVINDRDTGFVKLTIKHRSSHIAKDFAEKVISELNSRTKERDIMEAKIKIDFLQEELMNANIESIQNILSALIQNEYSKIAIASASPEYFFAIIDSPIAPEDPSSPNRGLISFLGLLLGLAIGIFVSIFKK